MKKFFALIILLTFASTAQAITLNEMRNIYMKGIQALANNELMDAEKSFRIIISLPGSSENQTYKKYQAKSYYFLGDVYFIQRDFDKAIQHYRKVVQDYMEQDIDMSGKLHTATYRLADTINEDFWCLDYSALNSGTRLGY